MNKKTILFIFVFSLILIGTLVVTAQNVCCERTGDGNFCQVVDESECASGAAPSSCEETSSCQLGTCVNVQKGTCSSNTPRLVCDEEEKGEWDPRAREDIEVCQNGCCLYGEDASFATQAECLQIGSDYAVDVEFRKAVKDEFSCYALAQPSIKGACVLEDDFTRDCVMTTKQDCQNQKGIFNSGFLCTASELLTNCAPTKKTTCEEDGKIYFLDSCGNLANVYDSSRQDEISYWDNFEDATCSGNNCGDCSYLAGSICREYRSGDDSTPTKPLMGDYVCADLGCIDNDFFNQHNRQPEHGESWCAESKGTAPHIQIDPENREFIEGSREMLEDQTKYNLPGSRYYKQTCIDGEVITDPCADYRNEICVEFEYPDLDEEFRGASCRVNLWRDCFSQNDQESCEDNSIDCKWVPGYRFDWNKVTEKDYRNTEEQGSCVPLISPGFDFWEEESDASTICSMAQISESALYEIALARDRDEFAEKPTCALDMGEDAVQKCFDNCYLIPNYGRIDSGIKTSYSKLDGISTPKEYLSVDEIMGLHIGEKLKSGGPEDYCLSDRAGYYCEDKSSSVAGERVSCTDKVDDRKPFPIFFNHEEFLNSIRERARSMGDCGYKENMEGVYSEPELEIITATFQKLNQQYEVRDESIDAATTIIYRGDEQEVTIDEEDYNYRGYLNLVDNYRGPRTSTPLGGITTSTAEEVSSQEETTNDDPETLETPPEEEIIL